MASLFETLVQNHEIKIPIDPTFYKKVSLAIYKNSTDQVATVVHRGNRYESVKNCKY